MILLVMLFPIIDGVQKHCHRLPHKAERNPEDHITYTASGETSIDHFRQEYQRQLAHHCQERMDAYHMTGYTNQHLVKNGREEEYNECSRRLG